MKKWLKRIGLSLLLLIGLALLTGFIYERYHRHQAERYTESRAGDLVDVGGHSLYYERKGSGEVTVVFESGAPGDHRAWHLLSDTIANYATTITYDRAGLLWSDRGPHPKTANNVSSDLAKLLGAIDAPAPYVLVGHSAAGVYFRPFISDHQDDIRGVLLIDPSHPDQFTSAPEELREVMQPPFFPPKWVLSLANEVGLPRWLSNDQLAYKSIGSGGAYDEIDYLLRGMGADSTLRRDASWHVPLVVISAGTFNMPNLTTPEIREQFRDHWGSLQIKTSQLSSRGKRIVADSSGHNMLYSERELIVGEILKLIQPAQDTTTEYLEDPST